MNFRLTCVNTVLAQSVAEMKAQGVWSNVQGNSPTLLSVEVVAFCKGQELGYLQVMCVLKVDP